MYKQKITLLLFLTVFSVCNIRDTVFTPPTLATIRFVHAAPNAPAINVFLDDGRINDTTFALLGATVATSTPTSLAFQAATGFLPVTAGSSRVRVFPATPRARPNNSVAPAIDVPSVDLPANSNRTVIVVGNATLEAIVINEDRLTTILDTINQQNALRLGQGAVRVVHASLSATPVSVNIGIKPVGTAVALTTVASGVSPRQITEYTTLNAGTYDVFALRAGSTDTTAALGVSRALVLGSRRVFTVLARGTADSTRAGSTAAFGLSILTDR
jgi:hypothetical protein